MFIRTLFFKVGSEDPPRVLEGFPEGPEQKGKLFIFIKYLQSSNISRRYDYFGHGFHRFSVIKHLKGNFY